MKSPCHHLLAAAVLCLLWTTADDAQAQARTFTDRDGRTLEAELVGVQGGNAVLKLPNGQTSGVPIERLSEEDQQFVRNWQAANPDFRVEISTTRERKERTGNNTRSREMWVYRITVTNRSSAPVAEGLTLHYLQLVEHTDRMASARDRTELSRYSIGSIDLPEIEPLGSHTVETEPIAVEAENQAAGRRSLGRRWSENLAALNVELRQGRRVIAKHNQGSYASYGVERSDYLAEIDRSQMRRRFERR